MATSLTNIYNFGNLRRFLKIVLTTIALLLIDFSSKAQQTQADSYTRYELLTPSSNAFRIIYDVSATTAGATYYWNTLRKGSEHKVDGVWDAFSGEALKWNIVNGKTAKENGLSNSMDDGEYLQIQLARPVPEEGESRIRIDKTYADAASYFQNDGSIVFSRTLGIKRNSIVLPQGYEAVSYTHLTLPTTCRVCCCGWWGGD